MKKILFICKKRNGTYGNSVGLVKSCEFICNALHKKHIECKVINVTDGNDIDREVSLYKPTHVFIEALWVTPDKFRELLPLHSKIIWSVRLHSKIPFLSNEGMAIKWLKEYDIIGKEFPNISFNISSNNIELVKTLAECYGIYSKYFPNIYCPPHYHNLSTVDKDLNSDIIDIGCFGAIRPFKNILQQALASIILGNLLNKKIRFHINGNRCEQKGEEVLKNLKGAFENTIHELVSHDWLEHKDFIKVVRKMDIITQISYSESFNIVSADGVFNNIPTVGSDEIEWLNCFYKANPNDIDDIVYYYLLAYTGRLFNFQYLNKLKLLRYNKKALKVWLNNL